jgi:cyanobactin maturation PatA/PatG family protease
VSATGVTAEWLSRLPGLDRLWSITKGRPEIYIAVLDGPADQASLFQNAGVQANGLIDHGTHVCSIISGSADGLVPGIAPNCSVISIPIFDPARGRSSICTQGDLAEGIRNALTHHANIINISASEQADLLGLSTELSGALQEAAVQDVLIVAATGNQGCDCDTIPASVSSVLAVGAHDEIGTPLLISNWGPNQRTNGLIAPGTNIPGACVAGGVCRGSGTSFATAIVSGIAGLLMSVDVAQGVKPSGAKVRKILLETCARPSTDKVAVASTHLSGQIDVARATDQILRSPAGLTTQEEALTANPTPTSNGEQQQPTSPSVTTPILEPAKPSALTGQRSGLSPAECTCGCAGPGGPCTCGGIQKKQLVYAIGRLGVSFISLARRDSIWRSIHGTEGGVARTPEVDLRPINNADLQGLFEREAWQAQAVAWTLSRTEVPMYAIVPAGAFAERAYAWMVEQWKDDDVEFISLPGVIVGQVTLYDGMTVDAVVPDLRGMYSWNAKRYTDALVSALPRPEGEGQQDDVTRRIDRFLSKIYFQIRNRGLSPEERALNAAATNAFNLSNVVVTAGQEGLAFRDVSVEKSPLNRPGSDYYDVLLTFFAPDRRLEQAALVARFTVDVSDTVPVVVGEPVSWYEY